MVKDEKSLKEVGDYWSSRSEGFSAYMIEHLDGEENKLYFSRIKAFSDTRRMKVLDIGCGPGMFSMILGKDGHDVTGIDYSDGMISKAKENCAEAGVPCNIMKMDAQNLDFDDKTFDLIVSRKVVWNLPDPVRAYSEWLRVLKDDGMMILFDGNYFLRMYDEEYKASSEKRFAEANKDNRNDPATNQGGDPEVLNRIAQGLPLSKLRRPQWDVGVLTELGAKSVRVDVDTFSESERDGRTVWLPETFILTVSKHVRKEDPGRPRYL